MTDSLGPLFAYTPPTEQERQLERVLSRQQRTVLAFLREVLAMGGGFTAAELRDYVARNLGATAPASCDRVLRELRSRGVVSYEVVNRAASRYCVTRLEGAEDRMNHPGGGLP